MKRQLYVRASLFLGNDPGYPSEERLWRNSEPARREEKKEFLSLKGVDANAEVQSVKTSCERLPLRFSRPPPPDLVRLTPLLFSPCSLPLIAICAVYILPLAQVISSHYDTNYSLSAIINLS